MQTRTQRAKLRCTIRCKATITYCTSTQTVLISIYLRALDVEATGLRFAAPGEYGMTAEGPPNSAKRNCVGINWLGYLDLEDYRYHYNQITEQQLII